MSDENEAMRERLAAPRLGESMIDRSNPDAEVYMFSFDDTLAFAASEVARERNRIKERVVTVMLAMHAGARLDAMADLIKELRDEP